MQIPLPLPRGGTFRPSKLQVLEDVLELDQVVAEGWVSLQSMADAYAQACEHPSHMFSVHTKIKSAENSLYYNCSQNVKFSF